MVTLITRVFFTEVTINRDSFNYILYIYIYIYIYVYIYIYIQDH